MKKIAEFVKKRYLLCIFVLLFIVLLLIVIIYANKKGTFGLDDVPSVAVECPQEANAGATVTCNIKLHVTGQKILSVNANYDFDEAISYNSFTAKNGFELYSVDENENPSTNGFAIVNLDGVSADTIVGTLVVKIPDDAATGNNYKIGLKTIELSNDEYEMVSPASSSASTNVTIPSESIVQELQINDLIVNEEKMLIEKLTVGTTYANLKEHFVTNVAITITSNDGEQLTDNDVVKTGDTISFALSGGTKTYTLSVFGDVTGNGIIKMGDVGLLYRYNKVVNDKSKVHVLDDDEVVNDENIAAGDVTEDGVIKMNDVGILYRYIKHQNANNDSITLAEYIEMYEED